MIEPLRSQYLAALGIENYAPRFILPGAKLSEPCAWLEIPDSDSPNHALVDESASTDKTLGEKNIAEKIVSEKAASESAQRTPGIDTTVKRPSRLDEPPRHNQTGSGKIPNAPVETGPQFALSIVLATGGILLIDNAPASSAERSAFQQLLNNMLPALRPAAAQYILDIFLWPLTRQPKIPRDAAAAKETLSAYLQKQIGQRSIDTVLLLGEAARQWCVFESNVRVIESSSLLACVKNPALKRSLWNDIRHVAER
jgi:hypothetical protein